MGGSGRTVAKFLPLTLSGTALFTICIYLLGSNWYALHLYALSLGGGGLLFLFILVLLSRFLAFRLHALQPVLKSDNLPHARSKDGQLFFSSPTIKLFPFFRLHLRLKGRLLNGHHTIFHLNSENVFTADGHLTLQLNFPASGQLYLQYEMNIRDVFGFTRTPCGRVIKSELIIRPPQISFTDQQQFRELYTEDQKNSFLTSEDEKYYMRDYVSGDRLRDINWKATIRTSKLITRTAPHSRQKSRVLQIYLRHFHSAPQPGYRAIAQLDYLRAWLIAFISDLQNEFPNFEFKVYTLQKVITVKDGAGLTHLEYELARTAYAIESPHHSFPEDAPPDEMFIFTTEYDPGVNDFLKKNSEIKKRLFFTTTDRGSSAQQIRFIENFSPTLFPNPSLLRGDRRRSLPAAPGVTTQKAALRISLY